MDSNVKKKFQTDGGPVAVVSPRARGSKKAAQTTGTKEWATKNVNMCSGCSNACIYCYARYRAVARFHQIASGAWPNEVVRDHDVRQKQKRIDGKIMFPSSHDITPTNIDAAETVLLKLLDVGNDVLIVSKPQLECIKRLCDSLEPYKDKIIFRFTIGFIDEKTREFWEPDAPTFKERLDCLRMAYELGFQTSVSAEPLLEPWGAKEILDSLRSFISHSLWIGKLNGLRPQTKWLYPDGHPKIDRLEEWQTDEKVREVYETLKDDPLIRWKDSYKKVIGLAQPTTAGLDI